MRTVQLMSMRKLMLPPVVSRGQYQIMESRIAMVEHIAMTDRAMTGPQWHNRRTSWRFSNVTKVERKFIFPLQGYYQYFGCWVPEMYWASYNVLLFTTAILQSQRCRRCTYFLSSSDYPATGQVLSHWGSLCPIVPRLGKEQHPLQPLLWIHYPCVRLKFPI